MQLEAELGPPPTIGSVSGPNVIVEEATRMAHSVMEMTRAVQ